MSERMGLADVLREYGVPLVTLNVTADQQNCLALREKLLAIRNASQGKEQGYLEVECTFYIDVHDIDRYLAGELPNLAEIPSDDAFIASLEAELEKQSQPSLRSVINATGVLLHTNLGRAPLSREALAAVESVSSGYSTLEYDLAKGARSKRDVHASSLLTRITGGESALVVNNNGYH